MDSEHNQAATSKVKRWVSRLPAPKNTGSEEHGQGKGSESIVSTLEGGKTFLRVCVDGMKITWARTNTAIGSSHFG